MYKRQILDFANMMELFQQYNVEFVSSTEKFDTSTPMGRAMLNICCLLYTSEYALARKSQTGELCGVYPVHIHIAGIYVKALSCIAYCVTVRQVGAGYICLLYASRCV